MKVYTIALLSLLLQPTLAKPETVIHDGVRVDRVEARVERFKPAKSLEVPKPLYVASKPKKAPVTRVKMNGGWVKQCRAWAKEVGITLPDAAIKLIDRESDCSPTVRNPSSSAGGIPQALPWTKMGCPLSEAGAPCQIKWMSRYVVERYGSFEKALEHSLTKNWY